MFKFYLYLKREDAKIFHLDFPKPLFLHQYNFSKMKMSNHAAKLKGQLRGGSICNENPFITSSRNTLGLYAILQTKDQSVAVIMVHETLFYLSKFFKLQTLKSTLIYTAYIFLGIVKTHFNKGRKACCIF